MEYLEFARQSDGLPLASIVTGGSVPPQASALATISGTIIISSANETAANAAFAFYKSYKALPYSPNALQVNNIIINNQNLMQQKVLLNKWFADNKTGFDYSNFASITHWAENDVRAWVGTYYCYSPQPPESFIPLVLPKTLTGEVILAANGTAEYLPVTSLNPTGTPTFGTALPLTYSLGILTFGAGHGRFRNDLYTVLQDMVLHGGDEGTVELFMTGKLNGNDVIVQPYKTPSSPGGCIATISLIPFTPPSTYWRRYIPSFRWPKKFPISWRRSNPAERS